MESEEDSKFFSIKKLFESVLNDGDCTHLFLMGDIFDLWVADHSYFNSKFSKTLSLLDQILKKGISVHYFEGNHDLDLDPYFGKRGVHVHKDATTLMLGKHIVHLEHGDQMDPEDKGYLFLRALLRTRFMRAIGRHMPGFFVRGLGNFMSSTSRKYTDRLKKNLASEAEARKEKIFEKIRIHVRKLIDAKECFHYFISGHVHERFHETLVHGGASVEVINLGSWLGEKKPYLVLTEQGAEFYNC